MIAAFAKRMLTEPDKRALWKFVYNFGFKGMLSIQRYKKRLRNGDYFPPFLFISVINSCQLRCQGCWVDVASPRQMISAEAMDRLISESKALGNAYFGLIGGEPFMHPELTDILGAHPDCYFQVFTNGHLIDDEMATRLRKLGNVTPLISIEGNEVVSDVRRGREDVLSKSLAGVQACVRNRLITGVATSVCQSNIDLVSEDWLRRLIDMGVHYVWFHTYRVIGPDPTPELALTPEQVLDVRRFIVTMRAKLPIGIVEPYWDHEGKAMCPMATGASHHIGPNGDIEPCPVIQFATGSIHDEGSLYDKFDGSEFLRDFRETAARNTRGCIILERPDLVSQLVDRHDARDTTQRGTAVAELDALESRRSQYDPENPVPEEHWVYRLAKKHWYNDFGVYDGGRP